eukprot:gene15411-21492_t
MSHRTGTDWRSSCFDYMGSTDANLRSSRRDVSPRLHRWEPGAMNPRSTILRSSADVSRVGMARGDPTVGAKSKLDSLLTAAQVALAELRVEVLAGKRLSNNASAAVFESFNIRMPSRPRSAPRQLQPYGSVFQPTRYDQRYSTQELDSRQRSVLPMQQGASPSKAVNDEVVRVLENRMAELNIEELVNKAIASALSQIKGVDGSEQRQAVNDEVVRVLENRMTELNIEERVKNAIASALSQIQGVDGSEQHQAVNGMEQRLSIYAQSVKLIERAQERVGSEMVAQDKLVKTVADATRQSHTATARRRPPPEDHLPRRSLASSPLRTDASSTLRGMGQ